MNTLLHDIRYAVRMLLKHKGVSAVALIALTLGIGANTAIFSLVNGVLLRPLPYPEPERIVYFQGENRAQGIRESNISIPDFADWAKRDELFSHTSVFATGGSTLVADNSEPERIPRAAVSSGFFGLMGIQPVIGRGFLAEEDQPNAAPVAVLSSGLWKRRFASDPSIIGKVISVSGRPTTVVGVMPDGFDFPEQSQIWTEVRADPSDEPRDNRSYPAIARLKPGVTVQQAQAQISAINSQLAQASPDTNKGWDARVVPLQERLVRELRPSLLALSGAVGFVLLIACANVANLLLARAAGRRKEIAIRTALGASRLRVVRQMLTESVLLSLGGGAFGLLLGVWLTDILVALNPPDAPRLNEVHLDYRVLGFTVVLALLTGIVFGLAPALHASRLDVSGSLKEGGRSDEGHRRTSARSLLLIGEVALSLVLLVGAGLLIRSFMRLQEVKPGFNPDHVLIASMSLPSAKYKADAERAQFYHQLLERVRNLSGVRSAGAAVNLPLGASDYSLGRAFIPEGRALTADESQNADYSIATPDYVETMQIPLLAGRTFTAGDNANTAKVALVNQTLAKRIFGSEQAALGKRITVWRDEKFARAIIGVIGDTKPDKLDAEGGNQILVPHAQDPSWGFMTLVVRAAADPASLAPAIRREVLALDKDQPIYNVQTMEEVVRKSIRTRRVSTMLFSVFAGTALLLAAVGIYGVMAYSVTQRTLEIGIRMALGAQKSDVLRLVVRQGMTLTLIGVIAGLAGAFALTRVIENLLFGIEASDPTTFLAISLLLMAVAFIACYLPARRAAKLDPVIALSGNA